MYYERGIDLYLLEWSKRKEHKPILLRGARQVGKSTAVRYLGEKFESYLEINFEKQPEYKVLFKENLDVKRIVSQISVMSAKYIQPQKTLLFLDEIQECPEAIMALRFFKEDLPDLHIIAAGSLLEFALEELPTFGVGRIHSMFMYSMTFDEFLQANGENLLLQSRNQATVSNPLSEPLHNKLVNLLRTYMLVGGMPAVVAKWIATHDFLQCQEEQDDIILSYEDDFPKYRKKVKPTLLRKTMRSVAVQATNKFVFSKVGSEYKSNEVKNALEMLTLAGIITPVTHTSANGLPFGSEADNTYRKYLFLDTGLMLRLLNMTMGNGKEISQQILTANVTDLVNKGSVAEMLVGLELLRYQTPNVRSELFYWVRQAKNSQAEIDYVIVHNQKVLPIEVKAGTQGGMKSLWSFMGEKKLKKAIRCSLENFGSFEYEDKQETAIRQIFVCPIYAVSMLYSLL